MGNLCAIFHQRFKQLINIIPCTRKAQLLDYILLGWQGSTYTLRNSDQKWFMKPYSEIVSETGIPKSTLMRYIKELADEGFIVRRQALYNRNNNGYAVKKGTYIHISDKLLVLLQRNRTHSSEKAQTIEKKTAVQEVEISPETINTTSESANTSPEICTNISQNERIDPLKTRGSYYISDLDKSLVNTITPNKLLKNVDNQRATSLTHQFETMQSFLKEKVQEEIPEPVKKRVLGTFFNLCFEHQVLLSNPKQVTAEYLYALTNLEFYLPEVKDLHHRNNILAKLLRNKVWKTPKGFYKYFYLSQEFQNNVEREKHIHNDKLTRELEGIKCPIQRSEIETRFETTAREEAKFIQQKTSSATMPLEIRELKAQLQEINAEIHYQGTYLLELEQLQDSTVHAGTIDAVKTSLEKLYKVQVHVENRLENLIGDDFALCA